MLVTFVQGIVGAGDEYFSPLDQASREETRDHAEDDFLQKGRVHFPAKGSRSGAMGTALPEAPLPRFHDPEAKKKICDRMSDNARSQILRAIGDAVIERAGDQRRDPVRPRMGETESDGDHREREPRERANRKGMEFFVNEIAKQESAPKNLLDHRDDNDQAKKTKSDRGPVRGWLAGKNLGIETVEARRQTEKSLRGYPQSEHHQRHCERKQNSLRRPKLVFAPEPEEQRAAEYCLGRIDPVLWKREPKSAAHFSKQIDQTEQEKKRCQRQRERHQLSHLLVARIHLVFQLNGQDSFR